MDRSTPQPRALWRRYTQTSMAARCYIGFPWRYGQKWNGGPHGSENRVMMRKLLIVSFPRKHVDVPQGLARSDEFYAELSAKFVICKGCYGLWFAGRRSEIEWKNSHAGRNGIRATFSSFFLAVPLSVRKFRCLAPLPSAIIAKNKALEV